MKTNTLRKRELYNGENEAIFLTVGICGFMKSVMEIIIPLRPPKFYVIFI